MAQPGDADPVADAEPVAGVRAERHHFADHLVAGDHGLPVNRQVALGDVQVGAAHAARQHGDQKLTRRRRGTGTVTRSSGRVFTGPGLRTCHAVIDLPVEVMVDERSLPLEFLSNSRAVRNVRQC